jgi:UDP-N-acetylglucosamine--N-acetylmuramyl-(pentapeptide) pyrophosphoryl-undecaprenol N-acetylglucosamine transferase
LSVIRKVKPSIIFSKGGFVSVPVVIAAKISKIPVVIHESDVTPGLANKIALPFASHIFTIFDDTLKYLPKEKATCTGSIVRQELFEGSKEAGLKMCRFSDDKQVLLIMGGSLGSVVVNDALRSNLPELLTKFNIIHLCGKGNLDRSLDNMNGYKQFEYVTNELPDLLCASDYIVSRAGSNSIYEFLALKKPMFLIPLSASKSRGDQILNAELTKKTFIKTMKRLEEQTTKIVQMMNDTERPKTPDEMVRLILQYEN